MCFNYDVGQSAEIRNGGLIERIKLLNKMKEWNDLVNENKKHL